MYVSIQTLVHMKLGKKVFDSNIQNGESYEEVFIYVDADTLLATQYLNLKMYLFCTFQL